MNFNFFNNNTYPLSVKCNNCKKIGIRRVPKGMSVKDYMQECPSCNSCGCEKLEVINKRLLE